MELRKLVVSIPQTDCSMTIHTTDPLDAVSISRVLDEVFPLENKLDSDNDCEGLLVELNSIGITTVRQLRDALGRTAAIALAAEQQQLSRRQTEPGYLERLSALNPKWVRPGVHFGHIGLARIALNLSGTLIRGQVDAR